MQNGYRLSISPERGDEYKLVWGDPYEELQPYCVSGSRVVDASEKVRDILSKISKHYRECEIIKRKPTYSQFLPDLTRAGEELSQSLFDPSSGDTNSANEARQLVQSMAGNRIALSIMISGTPLHVPWGFLYRGDPDADFKLTETLADFKDFWTSIFDINVSYSRARLFRLRNERIASRNSNSHFFLLQALHDSLFDDATKNLSPDDQGLVAKLAKIPIGSGTDWRTCRKKWQSGGDTDSIIYVFGHSDGRSIFLSNSDDGSSKLDANGFSASFKKQADTQSKTICFLNGCRSGGGYLGSSFLTVTSSQGFYGFIGSEAELSNVFAARYGAEFISQLCIAGLSVQETFSLLRDRVDLFPLNLFYSCYALPEFRLISGEEKRCAS